MKWTQRELGYVRRWYRQRPAAAIAEHLGKSIGQVYGAAHRLGLAEPRVPIPRFRSRLRRYHRRGWSDAEIAAELGCSREYVRDSRREMGLKAHNNNARRRRRVAAKTREQCRRAGVPNLGALRAEIHRERALAAGWPADLRPRHVQILDLLYDEGPKTRRQIAAAIGMPWKGSRKSLVSNDPEGSYLAHLMARGLVVCLPRKLPAGGRGKNVSIYMIPLNVKRDEQRRNRCARQMETASSSRRSAGRHSPISCAE